MRLGLVVASFCLLACRDGDDFPGGSPPTDNPIGDGEGMPDAGPVDASADATPPTEEISGVVCRVQDVRVPTTCTSFDASDFVVSIQGTDLTSAVDANGRFRFPLQPGSQRLVLVASLQQGDAYVNAATTVRLDPGGGNENVRLGTLDRLDWDEINAVNQLFVEGVGHVFVHVVDASGMDVEDVAFSTVDGELPYYDQGDPVLFSTDGTLVSGDNGFGAYLAFPPGSVDFDLSRRGGAARPYSAPVIADGVTFYTAVFP